MTSGVRSGVSALRSWEWEVLKQICKTALLRNLLRTKLCLRNLEHQKFSMKTESWIVLSTYEAEIIKACLKSKFPLPWANTEAEPVQPYSIAKEKGDSPEVDHTLSFLQSTLRLLQLISHSVTRVCCVWFSRREVRSFTESCIKQTRTNSEITWPQSFQTHVKTTEKMEKLFRVG